MMTVSREQEVMPEDPNKPGGDAKPTEPNTTSSPSPQEVAGDTAAPPAPPPPADGAPTLPAEALADGTVPTVLAPGSGPAKKKGPRGRASLTSIYRRADIMTTLFTFAGAIVAGGLILGAYVYFTHGKNLPTTIPKITGLSQSDLAKLGSFFNGNSAGGAGEILTITSSSLFQNRVALGSDLKVVGGVTITGPTSLGDLVVDKTSTLGPTNVRGTFNVAGPVTLQSPAVFSGGATTNGNLSVTGNGSFGGSLAAGLINTSSLTVTGTLNLAGHLAITGTAPSVATEAGAGNGGGASIDGNDSGGSVTVNTGSVGNPPAGTGAQLVKVIFHSAYAKVPRVIISPTSSAAANLGYYVIKTSTYFIIATTTNPVSGTGYSFDYWVVQ